MPVQHRWRGPELMAVIRRNAREAVDRSAVILQIEIKRQLSGPRGPSAAPQPPGVGTGHLRRSVQIDRTNIAVEPNRPRVRVGPGAVYAAIQEFGGTIFPKKARALAVPIGEAGRKAARSVVGSIRKLALDFIPRKGKPPLLARTRPDGTLEPLFVLLSSVTLPPRPYVRPAVRAARSRIIRQFSPDRLLRGFV